MIHLYILDINPLSVIWFTNIFPYSLSGLFILLMVSFTIHKPLHLGRLLFLISAFISFKIHIQKNYCCNLCQRVFCLYFPLGFLWYLALNLDKRFAFCSNMDGLRGHYAKWNKSDKERKVIWYHLYIEPKKYNKLVNVTEKKKTHRSRSSLYLDVGKDWGWKENGATDDEMVGWNHQLSGHEFDQTPGDSKGQGSLTCCSSWGHKELDVTSQLNNNKQNKWGLTSGSEWGRIYGHGSGR